MKDVLQVMFAYLLVVRDALLKNTKSKRQQSWMQKKMMKPK